MVAVQQPHKYTTPRLVPQKGNTFQNFATYMSFITKFLQVSPRQFENLISGAPNKSRRRSDKQINVGY